MRVPRVVGAVVLCLLTGCANSFQVSVYTGGTTYQVSTGGASQPSSSAGQSSFVASSDTSSGSTAANLPSSLIVGGSALLLAVAGGIITTVYQGNANARARLQAEEFRKLHPPPQVAPPSPPAGLPPPSSSEPTPPPPPPQASSGEPTLDAMVMARAWLLANELQLKQDLALGAGPALDDLAGIAGIAPAHRAHFGRVLQQHRSSFSFDAQLTPGRASLLMSRVGELVLADPILAADGARASR